MLRPTSCRHVFSFREIVFPPYAQVPFLVLLLECYVSSILKANFWLPLCQTRVLLSCSPFPEASPLVFTAEPVLVRSKSGCSKLPPQPGCLTNKQQEFIARGSGAWRSKVRVPANSVFRENLLPGH